MSAQTVAEIFWAYLVGDVALKIEDRSSMGPFNSEHDSDRWQLDPSNDFFLTVDQKKGTAEIRCRYLPQERIIEAMVGLFNAVYNSE